MQAVCVADKCPVKIKEMRGDKKTDRTDGPKKIIELSGLDIETAKRFQGRPGPFPINLIPEGWLLDYVNLVLPGTEAAPQLHLATGLVALGTVCRRNVFIPWALNKPLYPNIFIVVFGESGEPKKSTAINMLITLLNDIDRNLLLGGQISPEAFCEALQFNPYRVMFYDEFLEFIETAAKSYGKGIKPAIIGGWDCKEMIMINLKNVPVEKRNIENPTLSFLAATTPEYFAMNRADITGGFLGRFLPICSLGEKTKGVPLPPQIPEEQLRDIKDRLFEISQLKGQFEMTPEAFAKYEELYHADREERYKIEDKASLGSFYSRKATHWIKLSMLFRLSSYRPGTSDDVFKIDKDTFLRAWAAMHYITDYYKFFLSKLTFSKEHKIENRALDLVSGSPEGYLSVRELMQKIPINSKKDWLNLCSVLEGKGLIIQARLKTARRPQDIVIWAGKYNEVREQLRDRLIFL
jgi:hypothetical protein